MRIPDNPTPILTCQGAAKCGWRPHPFVRIDRVGLGQSTGRLIFKCGECGAERLFGVVDLAQAGRAE